MIKTVVGIDIAKRVFQLHWIDRKTGEIMSLQLKREKFLEHFANRQTCLIGREACGGAQHWDRLRFLGMVSRYVALIADLSLTEKIGAGDAARGLQ